MRRADPPVVALADTEGAATSAYPDSDVGSSPRSISAHGGRPGSLTEEPIPASTVSRWDDTAFSRVKLMCSYGGRIMPRPHDSHLRYVGGDSRIAVVNRGIGFAELTAKLTRMFGTSVVIKYQLPFEDLDALISVTSDEDLENMMEEYDRLHSAGIRSTARLRLFLFPSKLQRSHAASLSEVMENNHSRERWFVDILNGLLPHVRSETSSIVSETPDYFNQSNTDSLEEWAAAASYGNTVPPPHTEQSFGTKQEDPASAAALFGSLLQHTSSSEVASAPGSPLPLRHQLFMAGSSSSAPLAVTTLLSASAEAASKALPVPVQYVAPLMDGLTGTHTGKSRLGSGDGSIGVPEQRKHVDGEVLLTSDKGVLNSSTGSMEQPLPAGLLDDDALQKLSSKGSFDAVYENPANMMFDASKAELSKVLRGEIASESPVLLGQPIFDEEARSMHAMGRNLNEPQLDESVPSQIMSLSGASPASAESSPVVLPQQPVSDAGMFKVSADDKPKLQVFPGSPRAGARLSSEDKLMQHMVPSSVAHGTVANSDAEDIVKQVSPPLAYFLSTLSPPQQVPNVVGENMVQQIAKSAEILSKPQHSASVTIGAPSTPSAIPPTLQSPAMQKGMAAPSPNYTYQAPALEVPMSATMYATQALGPQVPVLLQTPSVVATNPSPPIAVPFKAGNVALATRPIMGTPRPQSPQTVMAGGPVSQIPQIRPASPPIVAPPVMPPNLEALKGIPTSMSPPVVFSSWGEAVKGIPAGVYPQVEVGNLQRQANDPLPSQRMAVVPPQPGSQFGMADLNTGAASGIPTRFRAVGRPMQQVVAEGIPMQQAPVLGVVADKKAPVTSQRVVGSPSTRPPLAPGGQYSYYVGDQQPNVVLHPAAVGGRTPVNVVLGMASSSSDPLPFEGATSFADNFLPISTHQDVLEVSPADQQQRRQMRP